MTIKDVPLDDFVYCSRCDQWVEPGICPMCETDLSNACSQCGVRALNCKCEPEYWKER
jgi:ATP sulfurylase